MASPMTTSALDFCILETSAYGLYDDVLAEGRTLEFPASGLRKPVRFCLLPRDRTFLAETVLLEAAKLQRKSKRRFRSEAGSYRL